MIRHAGLLVCLLLMTVISHAQRPAFAEASVETTQPFVGQAVLYTLRTYTSGTVENSRIIEPPLIGFGRAAEMLEPQASTENRNGTLYTVTEQSYVLYPLRVGSLVIEAFRVEIPETPFQDGATLITEPITLDVRPLPDNAPETFRNAIGQFTVEARVDRETVRAGDPVTLSLTVTGSGNLERTLPPALTMPEDWQIFSGSSQFVRESSRFGQKTFDYTIFPAGEGIVTLPPLAFSAFNPQSEAYETTLTQPISLTVTAGEAPPRVEIITLPEANGVSITAPPELVPLTGATQSPWPTRWFWGLWLLAPIVTLVLWLSGREQSPSPRRNRVSQRGKASNAFRQLRRQLQTAHSQEAKNGFQQIEKALDAYLIAATGQTTREAALASLPDKPRKALMDCLREAASGQYAPVGVEDVVRLSERVLSAAMLVEKGRS